MAYYLTSDPIPMNSMTQPAFSPAELAASQAYGDFITQQTAQGRLRTYHDVPSLQSFYDLSPELAGDALKILSATDVARKSAQNIPSSVASGLGDLSTAPIVVPINSSLQSVQGGPAIPNPPNPVLYPTTSPRQPGLFRPLTKNAGPSFRRHHGHGFAGYEPPWGDAMLPASDASGAAVNCTPGFWGWVQCHPWLSLGIAAVGVGLVAHHDKTKGARR